MRADTQIKKKHNLGRKLFRQRYLMLMSLPFVVWLIVFKYIPLWGWSMAFQKMTPAAFAQSFFERTFVGFDNFAKAFKDRLFNQTLINTVSMSLMGIIFGTLMSLVLAIVIHEIRFTRLKKLTQTVSYLPHFVSWVIIASIAKMVLNDGGLLDTIFGTRLSLMSKNSSQIWWVITFVNIWKEMGWDAIIYLSAISGVDQGLYEAAEVDGAGRLRRIWNVTLPSIRPTIIVILIMSIGGALNVGMERQMLMSNAVVQDHTMVLSWFAYLRGIGSGNYGVGTAIGMFQSVVGIILLFVANSFARFVGEDRLI